MGQVGQGLPAGCAVCVLDLAPPLHPPSESEDRKDRDLQTDPRLFTLSDPPFKDLFCFACRLSRRFSRREQMPGGYTSGGPGWLVAGRPTLSGAEQVSKHPLIPTRLAGSHSKAPALG